MENDYRCEDCGERREAVDEDGMLVIKPCRACADVKEEQSEEAQ
jgi:hypothetical protein